MNLMSMGKYKVKIENQKERGRLKSKISLETTGQCMQEMKERSH